MENCICLEPIGVVHTDFKELKEVPRQPSYKEGCSGKIEIFPKFSEGLIDLNGFSHIIVIFYFDKCERVQLKVVPFLDKCKRGVFSTRAPSRPNHIGVSLVEIDKIENNFIFIKNADMLDNTPIFDIKPFVSDTDTPKTKVKMGWINQFE